MILSTAKDFERVTKALLDPESQPHQYRVKIFGYCTECSGVVEFEMGGGVDDFYEKCLKCGTTAYKSAMKRSIILQGEMVPAALKSHVDYLHSRGKQTEFFVVLLEDYIATTKTKIERTREVLAGLERELGNLEERCGQLNLALVGGNFSEQKNKKPTN